MRGLVAMSCGETARFSEPYDSLMNLERPEGWSFRQARSMSIAENWNNTVRALLASDAEWLFLTNDDHVYPPDTLTKLLARDRDVVTGLYLSRLAPFLPVLADRVAEDGGAHPYYLEPHTAGLVRVQMCGDGCLLVRRRVLEAIAEPWWELGTYQRDAVDHDNAFCAKVRAAGFMIWCDLDVTIGHLAVVPIFPHREPSGQWVSALIAGPNAVLIEPQPSSPLALVV